MDELTAVIVDAVLKLAIVVIGLIVSGATTWLKEKALETKTKTSNETYTMLENLARNAVKATEQMFQDFKGQDKLMAAIQFGQRELAENGYVISDDQLQVFIEAAVKEMNDKNVFNYQVVEATELDV